MRIDLGLTSERRYRMAAKMFEYIIRIDFESSFSYVRDDRTEILNADIGLATRYSGYYQALNRLVKILSGKVLNEPAAIHIVPSPESWGRYQAAWTTEEILRNAG